MKKTIILSIIFVLILALASCATVKPGDNKPGGQKPAESQKPGESGDKPGDEPGEPAKDSHPRVTYYDGKEGYEAAASLQNAHLVYNYGEDRQDGSDVVSYPFEFMNCEDYHYHRRYTLVGYDEARKGTLAEADDHVAIVFDGGKYVLYDFYRKLIVDDFPLRVVNENKTFLPEGPGSATFNIYQETMNYEEESSTQGKLETICGREEIDVTSSLCEKPGGYELTKLIITHSLTDHGSQITITQFTYDTETGIGLYAEYYTEDDPVVKIDETSNDTYYEFSSTLDSVVEVTVYEVGTVSPADVTAKVNELVSGNESEFRHVSFDEYSEIFA
ncbi:MAG: hypothetical protein ILO53_01100 [Clostridia bacterium]|nr:hypothetical protein [Clostridia bacterium]